jgi:hypothetical protein
MQELRRKAAGGRIGRAHDREFVHEIAGRDRLDNGTTTNIELLPGQDLDRRAQFELAERALFARTDGNDPRSLIALNNHQIDLGNGGHAANRDLNLVASASKDNKLECDALACACTIMTYVGPHGGPFPLCPERRSPSNASSLPNQDRRFNDPGITTACRSVLLRRAEVDEACATDSAWSSAREFVVASRRVTLEVREDPMGPAGYGQSPRSKIPCNMSRNQTP